MEKEKINWSTISIIVCTYNCKENTKKCFESLKKQDYPKDKLEFIAIDGHSKDGTLDVLKEMKIKTYLSNCRPERGAKTLGYEKANGEIIMFIDSDNNPIEKDWIKKMVKPLIIDNSVNFCISRIAVVKSDKMINRYLSLIGPDPFVSYCFIDAALALGKLKLMDGGDYYTYTMTLKNFITTGGNYFTIRKKTLQKIGGYTQDTDVGYNLTKNGFGKVAIPKNAHLHHHIAKGLVNFVSKKVRWGKIFFKEQRYNRAFNWIPQNNFKEKIKISYKIFKNLLIFPGLFIGIWRAIKYKESAWLLHPLMLWFTTSAYLYSFFTFKFSKCKI